MAAETSAVRAQTRRVKGLVLNEIENILTGKKKVSKEFYNDLFLKLASNVIPRSQEVTGEDGAPLVIQVSKEIADKNGINSSTSTDSEE